MSLLRRAAAAVAALTLLPLSAMADKASVTGTAIYRERIALPPNAVFTAVLLDVSLQDAPAKELGRTVIDPAGHPPYRFAITFDPAAIEAHRSYSVRTTIDVGERLMFTSDNANPVLTRGAGDSVDIVMKMAGAQQKHTAPAPKPARYSGLFRYMADAALFQECRTGQRYPVAMEKDFPRLERAYRNAASEPGAPALASVAGAIEQRPKMDGEGTEATLIVHRLDNITGSEKCVPPIPDASLTNTYWRLSELAGKRVGAVPGSREPHILLETDRTRYRATAGCNGLGGAYELDGQKLSFTRGISTLMACPPPVDGYERGLKEALGDTARWEIHGVILSLLNDADEVVARFRAVYLQ